MNDNSWAEAGELERGQMTQGSEVGLWNLALLLNAMASHQRF